MLRQHQAPRDCCLRSPIVRVHVVVSLLLSHRSPLLPCQCAHPAASLARPSTTHNTTATHNAHNTHRRSALVLFELRLFVVSSVAVQWYYAQPVRSRAATAAAALWFL